jgi:MFS family permease
MPTANRTAVYRLSLARLISLAGGAAAYTALMFTVFQKTHSAAWLSAAALATFGVEGFFGPVVGALGDRFDRRKVMIASDLAGAACFGAMAFTHEPGPLLVLACLSAIVETPFFAASQAAVPNLVGPDLVGWANGRLAASRNLGIALGPVVGGLLLAKLGVGRVFAINAVTFVASAALVATVRGRFAESDRAQHEGLGLRVGISHLVRTPVLVAVTLAWNVSAIGFGFGIVADVPLCEAFGVGAVGFGLIVTVWGAGSVIGSLMGRFTDRREVKALLLGLAVVAVTGLVIGVSPWFALILGAMLIMGTGDALAEVATRGIQQRHTPDALRSRVAAASEGIVNVMMAISFALGGVIVSTLGPQPAYALGGITAALGAIALVVVMRRSGVSAELTSPGDPPALARE